MTLLDHPLVRKYFGCDMTKCGHFGTAVCQQAISHHILLSMQKPIKKGDKYLDVPDFTSDVTDEIKVCTLNNPSDSVISHPYLLRLPDSFQIKDEVEDK